MRKGIADLHRLAELSDRATDRYMDALAQVDQSSTVQQLVGQLSQRKQWQGQWVRGLQPFGKDNSLLLAVNRGEFILQGVRNRDLQRLLFSAAAASVSQRRRRGAWVSRQLRLLRAQRTHRYQVTESGYYPC